MEPHEARNKIEPILSCTWGGMGRTPTAGMRSTEVWEASKLGAAMPRYSTAGGATGGAGPACLPKSYQHTSQSWSSKPIIAPRCSGRQGAWRAPCVDDDACL
eukprot:1146372-Pelagomonas_calceolata.AAC.1